MKVEASSSGEEELSLPEGNPGEIKELDPGEHEAFLLAVPSWQSGGTSLLIDERAGRAVARELGVIVTGTIGVLGAAAQKRLVDPAEAVRDLRSGTRPERNHVSRLVRPVPLARRQGKIEAVRAGEAGLQHGTFSFDHPLLKAHSTPDNPALSVVIRWGAECAKTGLIGRRTNDE
jgi:hypothetical protein